MNKQDDAVGYPALLRLQSQQLLVYRLSVLLVLLHGFSTALFQAPGTIICGWMLVRERAVRHEMWWYSLVAVLVASLVVNWYWVDNHIYLITFWALACWLSTRTTSPDTVLKWNGRLLVGLVFLFAVWWKIIAGQYVDGSFWEYTMLTDPRIDQFTGLLGGVDRDALALNRDLVATLLREPSDGVRLALTTSDRVGLVARGMSLSALALEGGIALTFLIPGHGFWARHRDMGLMAFILVTYFLLPVVGFASVLAVMGIAQSESATRRNCYIALLGAIQLAGLPWNRYLGLLITN